VDYTTADADRQTCYDPSTSSVATRVRTAIRDLHREGGALSCAPSADAVAGNGAPV